VNVGALRTVAAIVAAAAVSGAPLSARAQTVIPPPKPAGTAAQLPTIEPADDLSTLVGKPIARVAVVLDGNVWDDVQVPQVASIKPGESFTPAAGRRALDELLATGQFARGRVAASPEGSGVLVVLRVVPRKLVDKLKIDLHGAKVDYDELLRDADLAEGGELVGADIDGLAGRIERDLAVHGYPDARATIRSRATDDPRRALVLVDVVPGTPRRIDQRQLYVFGAPEEQVLPIGRSYGANVGDRADGPILDAADAALQQALRVHGWSRAVVTHDLTWVGAPGLGQRVVLRVRIDSGPLQTTRYEGSAHYDGSALDGALGLDTETDRSPGHLADKLRTFFQKRGFLDVEVRPELRGGDGDTVQVVVFHIEEHPRVSVTSRRYPCLKLDAVRRLSAGGPRSAAEIGTEIESFLDEDLPGAELLVGPDPKGLSVTLGAGGGQAATGARPVPLDLRPDSTYVADTYDRAAEHVQELYRNEGFLHARVGPVGVIRARCDARSPAGRCAPVLQPQPDSQVCTYDATGMPLPTDPIDPASTCRPDPAHGVECAPEMKVWIPIKLGPRTQLWDVAFTGIRSVSEKEVADAAQVPVGDFVSTIKLDDARRRISDWYKELGYAYVDVRYALEPSLDNTRARVRFDVIEGEQVRVTDIVIRGLVDTRESIVRRRIALAVGEPYRASDARKTKERMATLGVFSSVTVSLSDPYAPAPSKVVIIDVVERPAQYVEVRPGFSTGEGIRGMLEYGHRNLFGDAVSLTFHVEASYLPDIFILDPQVKTNYDTLGTADRIATRDTVTLGWQEMGLGPTIRSQLDGVYVRDLERDFTLTKSSGLGTLIWRPSREVQVSFGPDYEHNEVHLFQAATIADYLDNPANVGNIDLERLLRVPNGTSNVVAARAVFTWDRRDAPFNAHRGTYVALGVEQANSYPVRDGYDTDTADGKNYASTQFQNHILRLTQTFAAYIPLTPKVSLATELRLGEIANLAQCQTPFDPTAMPTNVCTYPDRFFFMGGFDSMRGWLQDAFIPQDMADQIAAGKLTCTDQSNCAVGVRGGNLMINPRAELRFPVRAPLDGALFADFGNVWQDPQYMLEHGFSLRADVGAGIRVGTPVGPLVFDYGINVTRRPYEDFGAFHFAIGLF
jgi:outer membrane protein insertion porin family